MLVMTVDIKGQSRVAMVDPVFSMSYDPTKVHFELAPPSLEERCPAARRGEKYWLYAYWKDGDTEFFLISSPASQLTGGAAVIRDGQCTLGNPDWVLTGNPEYHYGEKINGQIHFSEATLKGLASDLLRRYATAFGGKKNLLAEIHKQGIPPDDHLPQLKKAFDEFAANP